MATRRDFVKTAGVLTGAMVIGVPVLPEEAGAAVQNGVPLDLTINEQDYNLTIDPRTTLLDLLREHLALTGTKKGCDHGQCGACTVLVNGRRSNSCLSLAAVHHGDKVTTIEGVAGGDDLHPVQSAFIEYDGLQCGYCTSGQICSAIGLLSEVRRGVPSVVTPDLAHPKAIELTTDEIRERMSGNICRCGAYPGIVEAVRASYRQT
ncbi:MAG TPA: 2Fe-2S iron-sulfur cluster-binding protein [Terriglobia bacterium]|jgi:xanthine dehydrogenase YagT iron-sulfur-binding subunit